MAKPGKLGKLLKKVQSLGRTTATTARNRSTNSDSFDSSTNEEINNINVSNMYPVYVGKSRRRYLVTPNVLEHPLFRELVERGGGCGGGGGGGGGGAHDIVVGCEVVLFEHLLWMLENADPQPELLDELVDFYAC